jgi:two-component system sensor histidine kinase RegB
VACEELVEEAGVLRDQVRRCQEIIDQMAAGAGQSIGEATSDVQLAEFLEGVLRGMKEGERVQLDVPESIAATTLRVPRSGLERALRAVLKNAIDASLPQDPVVLKVDRNDGWMRLEVVDRGEGIPEDILPRVVEPFFSTKAPGRGMGLGLFLTDNFLRDLGGSFHLEPGSDGRGTCARLEFPVHTG